MTWMLKTFLDRVIRQGTLEVELATGARFAVGNGGGPALAVRFRDRSAVRRLLANPALAFGELVMDGRLVVSRGSLCDLLDLIARNLKWIEPPGVARTISRARKTMRPLHQWNTRHNSRRNVAHHYDLDMRLYELFLDVDRQYSCAYFEHDGQSLDEAQQAKKRHIAAKLLVEPGHCVLDIGSGWGGLALYLAQTCEANVTGVTLSEEQLRAATARADGSELNGQVAFRLQDFRDVPDTFDRIVSVGMFEHVGAGYYDTFFVKASQVLADDGVMLLHSIGRMDGPGATNPWIAKYIFPGGYIPALSEVLSAIERAGLVVTDVEILRLHYAETLKAWRERFLARRAEVAALYDERFCRMWEFYLAASESAFRHSGLMVFQIQIAKQQHAVPLTRNYIEARKRSLQRQERRIAASTAVPNGRSRRITDDRVERSQAAIRVSPRGHHEQPYDGLRAHQNGTSQAGHSRQQQAASPWLLTDRH